MANDIIDSLCIKKLDNRIPKQENNIIDGNMSIKKKINCELAKTSRREIDIKKEIVNCK